MLPGGCQSQYRDLRKHDRVARVIPSLAFLCHMSKEDSLESGEYVDKESMILRFICFFFLFFFFFYCDGDEGEEMSFEWQPHG